MKIEQSGVVDLMFFPLRSRYYLSENDQVFDRSIARIKSNTRFRLIGMALTSFVFMALLVVASVLYGRDTMTVQIPGSFIMRETWYPPISISFESSNQLILEIEVYLNNNPLEYFEIQDQLNKDEIYHLTSNGQPLTGVLSVEAQFMTLEYLIIQIVMLSVSLFFLALEYVKYRS